MYCCPSLWYFCPKRPNLSLLYYVCFVTIVTDRVTFSFQVPATFFWCMFRSIFSFSSRVESCDGQKAIVTIFRHLNESASSIISLFFQSFLHLIKINRYFPMPLAFIPFSRGIQLQSL